MPTCGRGQLTDREWEVATLLLDGLPTREIARRHGATPSTVRSHVHNIKRKLDVREYGHAPLLTRLRAIAPGMAPPPQLMPLDPYEGPLTPGQRLYLDAFDRFLDARHDPDRQQAARGEMSHMLETMCIERQTPRPAGDNTRKPNTALGRLLTVLEHHG